MPDLPSSLPASLRASNDGDFDANIESAIYDITDAYNSRCDSQRQTLLLSQTAGVIPDLPTFGCGLLLVNGTKNGQPAGIFIMCKSDQTQAGQVSELMQVLGTGNFHNDKVMITWPANSPPRISATSSMLVNVLWRN